MAVILSSIATLETTMLQFSRTLFSMGRDGAMPGQFGSVDPRTRTPVRAMLLLIGMGLLLLWGSSLMPTVNAIIGDSVRAVGVLVAYYYGSAGFAAGWAFRSAWRHSLVRWAILSLLPAASALALIGLGIYAVTTFDRVTNIVGLGGLVIGIIFFRARGYAAVVAPAALPNR